MNSTTTSGSDRRLDRKQGLARISALTLGAGAAGLVGAVAIATSLPGSTVVSALSSGSTATQTSGSTTTGDDDSTPQVQPQVQSQVLSQAQSQLQSGTSPTTTNNPPVATSGAS